MSEKKPIIAWILILALTLVFALPVYAQDDSMEDFLEWYAPYKEEVERRREEIMNSPESFKYIGVYEENLPLGIAPPQGCRCYDCDWMAVTVCEKEPELVSEGYHKSGLFSKADCYAYEYVTKGEEICANCYKIHFTFDEYQRTEVHSKCDKAD